MSLKSIIVLALMALTFDTVGQQRVDLGIAYRLGISHNLKANTAGADDVAISQSVPAYSGGVYGLIKFKKDSIDRPLKHIKVSFLGSARGGVFDVNSVPKRNSLSYLDLEALLPINVKISDNLYYCAGIGGVASFAMNQTENTPEADSVQPGIVIEIGLTTGHGSHFGVHLLNTFADISLQSICFNFGITLAEMKSSARKMRKSN